MRESVNNHLSRDQRSNSNAITRTEPHKWFPKNERAQRRRRRSAAFAAAAVAMLSVIIPRTVELFEGQGVEATDGVPAGVKEGKNSKFFYSEADDKWYYRVESGDTPEQMANDTFGTNDIDQNTRDAFVAALGDDFEAGSNIEVPSEIEGLENYQLPQPQIDNK